MDSSGPDYTELLFPPAPLDRPTVILNGVMSADGKAVIKSTEQGIGSSTDQRLMRELRLHADIVLNGAETLRTSGTSSRLGFKDLDEIRQCRGKTVPIAAVLSRSGNLPVEKQFFRATDFPAVVYLSETVSEKKRKIIEDTGRSVVVLPRNNEIKAMLVHMRNVLNCELLLVEGGPAIYAAFYKEGCVDEVFLTIGPVIVAGEDTLSLVSGKNAFSPETVPHLELVSSIPNMETSEVYLRYRMKQL